MDTYSNMNLHCEDQKALNQSWSLSFLVCSLVNVSVFPLSAEGRKSEEKPDEVQYDIFTAPKDAIYFIHGQVNRADGKGKVYLFWKHISRHNFNTINGTCPEVTFATEVKLIKGDQVYLVFNEGKPNLKRSTFTVYELVEQWPDWKAYSLEVLSHTVR